MSFFSGSIGVTALVSVDDSSAATLATVTQHLDDAIDPESFLLGSDLKISANPSVVPAGRPLPTNQRIRFSTFEALRVYQGT